MYYVNFNNKAGNPKEKAFTNRKDAEQYFYDIVDLMVDDDVEPKITLTDDKCRMHMHRGRLGS